MIKSGSLSSAIVIYMIKSSSLSSAIVTFREMINLLRVVVSHQL